MILGKDSFRKLSQSELEVEKQAAEEKEEQDTADGLSDSGGMKMNM